MMLLQIQDLRVEAGAAATPIVDGISLTLERGEVLGLIGESGAGKSTIGLAALGYARSGCRITRGRIVFGSSDLRTLPAHALEKIRGTRIAYVAQSAAAAFNPAQKLMTQICEVPINKGIMSVAEVHNAARILFERLRLPDPAQFGERYPHQVSGGQLQRAMMAMAMICKPDMLVLDEPTTALDGTTQISVLALMRELIREDHVAALYITHDLGLVAQLAQRVMVLRSGRLVEEGTAEAILYRPKTAYARALIAARNLQRGSAAVEADAQPLLEIEHVSARYGTGPAVVDDVNLRVGAGETLAIVGESGSGKSTLARVILGLMNPFHGTIRYRGSTIGILSRRDRELCRSIQLIHQNPDLALNPKQRVRDILGRPLALFDPKTIKRRDRVVELLDLVGLPAEIATRLPQDLSGGQKQRVCIARALAANPTIIVCDEITASLDTVVAKEVIDLFRGLKREFKLACLLITHDFGVVNALADRVVVMQRGLIVEEGTLETVINRPQTAYAARLINAIPRTEIGWLDKILTDGYVSGEGLA